MGIYTFWDNDEKTIIRTVYEQMWTWEEYRTVSLQAGMMLASVPHRVDAILDRRHSTYVPPGYMEQIRATVQVPPIPNLGIVILLGERVSYEIFRIFVEREGDVFFRYAYARNLIMAYSIISASRAGIGWRTSAPPTSDQN
jgi:hypothetical protein